MENDNLENKTLDELSPDELKKLVKGASSEALATQVILYRLLGLRKAVLIFCMEELQLRRQNGDPFNFNVYIEEESKKFPQPQISKQNQSFILNLLKFNKK